MNSQTMNQPGDAGSMTRGQNGDSPFIFEFFLVQGLNFCCMAYKDDNGKWRMAFNHAELPGDVRVVA
jgi:hypothetical protein